MVITIIPRLFAHHQAGWETYKMRGLLDFTKCTYCRQGSNAGQAKPKICPAFLRRRNTAGQACIDKKDDGQSTRDRHHLEVLHIEVTCEGSVGSPCQEPQGRVAEKRNPGGVYVRKNVAEKPK